MKEDKNKDDVFETTSDVPEVIEDIDIPGVEEPEEGKKEEGKKDDEKKKDLDVIATEFAIAVYGFAAHVRSLGHVALSEMMFKEVMNVNLAANMASDSIGKERFIRCLEEGFNSSGRVIEYLKFSTLVGVTAEESGRLYDEADKIHRIFAASLRTATGNKKQSPQVQQLQQALAARTVV